MDPDPSSQENGDEGDGILVQTYSNLALNTKKLSHYIIKHFSYLEIKWASFYGLICKLRICFVIEQEMMIKPTLKNYNSKDSEDKNLEDGDDN